MNYPIKKYCQKCISAPTNKTKQNNFITSFCNNKKVRGQGAIEYLLLLAAAIIVVSVVVTFLVSTIAPIKDTGDDGTYNYLCTTLDSNTEDCACYKGNDKNYFPINNNADQNGLNTCCAKDSSLLKEKWNCP